MRGWQVVTGASDNWSPAVPRDAAIHALLPPSSGPSVCAPQWPPVVSSGLGGSSSRDAGSSSPAQMHRVLSTHAAGSSAPQLDVHADLLMPFPTTHHPLFKMPQQSVPPFSVNNRLSAIPETQLSLGREADQLLLQQLEAAEAQAAGDGHSSGRSGGGHIEVACVDNNKREAAASSYHLRTRSSSLREAWVEKPLKEEEEEAEEEEAAGDADAATEEMMASDEELAGSTDTEDDTPRPQPRKGAKAANKAAAGGKAGKAAGKAARTAKASAASSKAGGGATKAAGGDSSGAGGSLAAATAAVAGSADDGSGAVAGSSGAQKRLGRPVVYQGDPDAPDLTDADRRKIKRRIANRESARRVRAKRAELMDELQIKVTALTQQNARLASHAAVVEHQRNTLVQQNAMLQQKLGQKSEESVALFNQLYQLRRLLPPETVAQAERDAAAATPPPSTPMSMHGSGMFVPITPPGGAAPDDIFGDTQCLSQGLQFL